MKNKIKIGIVTFKVGDACYFDFQSSRIDKMEGDRIVDVVQRGGFRVSAHNLNNDVFPVTEQAMKASAYVGDLYRNLHNINFNSLNYPDFHKAYVAGWAEMCNAQNQTQYNFAENHITLFHNSIMEHIKAIRKITVPLALLNEDEPRIVKLII